MTAPVAPPPQQSHSGTPQPPAPTSGSPLVQRVLLGAGALCVLVAGAVYLTVSWHRIGTTGQAAFALVVTALAAVAAQVFARRGLRASAETFAAVAAGLFALDLSGAHHLDVLGARGLEWWLWMTVATAAVLAVTAALALTNRLATYRVVAVAALATLPFTAALAARNAGFDAGPGTLTVLALAVAAALAALALVIGRGDVLPAIVALVGASAWWLIAAVAGIAAAWSSRPLADVLPAAAVWGGVAAGLLVLAGRALAAGRTGTSHIVASVAGPLAAVPAPLVLAGAVTSLGPVATLLVAAAAAALWAVPVTTTAAGRPLGLAAAATAALLVPVAAGRGFDSDVTGGLVLLLGAAAAGAVAHTRGAVRVVAATAALAAAVIGSGLLAIDRPAPAIWLVAAWTTLAIGSVVTATFVGPAREGLLAAGGVVGLLAGAAGFAAQVLDPRSPALVVALLGLGAAFLVHGAVRTSRPVVVVGASALALAGMDLALVARVTAVEAYTLPIAAVALVAGVLARIGRPELSSWAWTAPAVLVAAVPSTAVALGDPGVTRLVATAVGAAVVVAVGARWKLAAPLVLGAATEAALAVSQLAPYAAGAPRWITLALAGVLLLALGVLFERARRGAAAAGRWYVGLR